MARKLTREDLEMARENRIEGVLTEEEKEKIRQALGEAIEKLVILKFEAEGLDELEERVERLAEKLVVVEENAVRALERLRELSQFLVDMGAEKVKGAEPDGEAGAV